MWFCAGSLLLIAFAASLVVLALEDVFYTSNLEVAALINRASSADLRRHSLRLRMAGRPKGNRRHRA